MSKLQTLLKERKEESKLLKNLSITLFLAASVASVAIPNI